MTRGRWLVGSLLVLAACGAGGEVGSVRPQDSLDLTDARLVDLSHAYDDSTLYWPTSPSRFEVETLSEGVTEGGFYYLAKRFATPEHGGTHLDAPIHFAAGAPAVGDIPLDRLVAPAILIDVSDQVREDADYRLSVEDVLAWEARHGRIGEGTIVLLRTGWSARWPDADRYYGRSDSAEDLDLHFPSFGPEAARLLVEDRRAGMLGVDTASIDHGPSQDFPVHRIAAAAEVPGLENLTRLEELPESGFWLAALPMKMTGASGAPVRVVALLPSQERPRAGSSAGRTP